MSQAQLALPGVVSEVAAEWIWTEETGEESDVPDFVHTTVMKSEVVAALAPEEGLYVDLTVGGGGHTEAILEAHPAARVVALDRDAIALDAAKARLERFFYFTHRPALLLMMHRRAYPPGFLDAIIEHVVAFTLGGLDGIGHVSTTTAVRPQRAKGNRS